MYETDKIELQLRPHAEEISRQLNGAPVVIIVGEEGEAGVRRTMTSSSMSPNNFHLRDLLGILQAAIQVESQKHL